MAKKVPFSRKCQACKATGKLWVVPMTLQTCSACNGLGYYIIFRHPWKRDLLSLLPEFARS